MASKAPSNQTVLRFCASSLPPFPPLPLPVRAAWRTPAAPARSTPPPAPSATARRRPGAPADSSAALPSAALPAPLRAGPALGVRRRALPAAEEDPAGAAREREAPAGAARVRLRAGQPAQGGASRGGSGAGGDGGGEDERR